LKTVPTIPFAVVVQIQLLRSLVGSPNFAEGIQGIQFWDDLTFPWQGFQWRLFLSFPKSAESWR
jgi:hypothetical protein